MISLVCERCGGTFRRYLSQSAGARYCSMSCRRGTLRQRFEEHVERASSGCWRWHGPRNFHGYGVVFFNGRTRGAHRIAYELFVGPIPDGMQLDHVCHTEDEACAGGRSCPHRACVNPEHLEPVTSTENIRRGQSQAARNARKTHCAKGHSFTPENTGRSSSGGRYCKTCARTASRRQHQKGRARSRIEGAVEAEAVVAA